MTSNQVGLMERLVPPVADYTRPPFALKEDLRQLQKVQDVGAAEGTIFYCNRILEVLTAAALERVGLSPSSNVFDNLKSLEHFNLIEALPRAWAHALRILGNDVRHLHRRVGPEDAELALAFAERVVDWFFRVCPHGDRLESLTSDGSPLRLSGCEELRALLNDFEAVRLDSYVPAAQNPADEASLLMRLPVLPAVLAELLLERQAPAQAFLVLSAGLKRYPGDFRLQQLMGLYFSRTQQLTRALEWLLPLYNRYEDDGETAGITAGVFKRLWREEGRPEWLQKSYQAYSRGWDRSRNASTYAGINTAAMALWLGRGDEARRVAAEVSQILERRALILARHPEDPNLAFNYWEQVTLAEAELLLGRLSAARARYQVAFARHPEQRANHQVSRHQAVISLAAMGLSVHAAEEFLARPSFRPEQPALRVGVTGHRTLPDDPPLHERVREVLASLGPRNAAEPAHLVIVSPLAEGADRLVAQLAGVGAGGASLHVVLPLEPADYRRDFRSVESLKEFQELLDQADVLTFPPPAPAKGRTAAAVEEPILDEDRRRTAYEWCGREVVDTCDVLLALWNGQPAQGRGGTAEIVDYARRVGTPVAWIRTTAPYEVTGERLAQR